MEGGSDSPLRAYSVTGLPFEPVHCVATTRQVIDLCDDNRSLIAGTSGESGHPASRHNSDMTKPWLDGECFLMLGIATLSKRRPFSA